MTKTLELVIKKHSFFFEKCKFHSTIQQNDSKSWNNGTFYHKFDQFEILLKVRPTKRENASKKMNYISFVTSASRENANFRFFVFFGPEEDSTTILLLISFHKLGWKFKLNASKLRDNLKFRNSEKLPVNFRSAHLKNQRCSALPQRKSVLISPDSA